MDINQSRVLFRFFDINSTGKNKYFPLTYPGRINLYMFLISVVWMSYAKLKQKILCKIKNMLTFIVLTRMFSLSGDLKLFLHEIIFIFEMTCKSIGRVLRTKMPSKDVLRVVAKKAFVSADMDSNGYLTIDEMELWCYNNQDFQRFLSKFGNNMYL